MVWRRRARRLLAALGIAIAGVACTTSEVLVQAGLPGVPIEAAVDVIAERYEYIDARIAMGGESYRFFFPRTDGCRQVLAADAASFVFDGLFGSVRSTERSCSAVGVLSLRRWRDRQGRTARAEGSRPLIPRDRVEYRVVYADDDLFLAHGRFRIAGMIGWPGGYDSIAAFPNVEACAGVRDQTTASMEFRPTGDQPFSVPDDDIRCPVLGFAQTPVEHDAPQP